MFYLSDFYSNVSFEEIDKVRYYTGIAYKDINSILRGNWNYETNGMLTEEKRKKNVELANDLSRIISNTTNIPANIKTYRGVGLYSFKDYGINSIEELSQLKGQYYFDSGFASTSLIRERSFFDRLLEYHDDCNIEIEYLIPEESNDGIPLLTDELSYSKVQSEYLINKENLSKIVDVKISLDGTKAYLKAILVPQKIWNLSYNNKNQQESTIRR